jgi:hypothetical protein
VFPLPASWLDCGGARFIPFVDREEPGYNASRSSVDLERLRQAAAGLKGLGVALQHTSLFPPGACDCPFNYTNAGDVIAAMKEAGVRLSLSGHFHAGFDVERDGIRYVTAPALCESPFAFLEIRIEGGRIGTVRHELRMP